MTPEPKKRPRSSYIRFPAEQPNETWQSDFTHHRLTKPDRRPGPDVEIITWLDDHARFALHVSAHPTITAPIVHKTFCQAAEQHGYPASTLTDNGMVYTVRGIHSGHMRWQRGRPVGVRLLADRCRVGGGVGSSRRRVATAGLVRPVCRRRRTR